MRKFIILLLCLVPLACSPENVDDEKGYPVEDKEKTIDPGGYMYSGSFTYVYEPGYETNLKLTISFGKDSRQLLVYVISENGATKSCSTHYRVYGDEVVFTSVSIRDIALVSRNMALTGNLRIDKGYLSAHAVSLDVEAMVFCDKRHFSQYVHLTR